MTARWWTARTKELLSRYNLLQQLIKAAGLHGLNLIEPPCSLSTSGLDPKQAGRAGGQS